jgi:hypothetical protein
MEVSFILKADELFTLMSLVPERTKAGQKLYDEAVSGFSICDLSGLVEKNLARFVEDELVLDPVLSMISSALSTADSARLYDEVWDIKSKWINLQLEKYKYNEEHWKITPLRGKEVKTNEDDH